jgi:hypothetical protein
MILLRANRTVAMNVNIETVAIGFTAIKIAIIAVVRDASATKLSLAFKKLDIAEVENITLFWKSATDSFAESSEEWGAKNSSASSLENRPSILATVSEVRRLSQIEKTDFIRNTVITPKAMRTA